MQSKYILEAISVLDQCAAAMDSPDMSPHTRGTLVARCFIAANALRHHSGIMDVEVGIDTQDDMDYTEYCMRQGEMGNPDRRSV